MTKNIWKKVYIYEIKLCVIFSHKILQLNYEHLQYI